MPANCYEAKYRDRLRSIPAPGGGGCHTAILGIANLGIMAGLNAETIFQDVRRAIPAGTRQIPDKEITDAINTALSDHNGGTYSPRPRPAPAVKNGKSALQKIINQGKITTEVDLWEASPLRLWEEPQDDPMLLLSTLYDPTDFVWIGDRYDEGTVGKTIRTAKEWITYFRDGGKTAPHIILNPLNGAPAPKKVGEGETLRGDANIKKYRFCLVEFDDLSREDQIRFWSAVRLPVVCLIDSGGKSIHAWLDVQKLATVETSEQWDSEIKQNLYGRLLTPLGVDSACSNQSRLSRLPGHYRTEKSNYQKILWLAGREGRFIA